MFLFEVCLGFHECLNARELRRQLARIYSTNALSEQVRMEREGAAPYDFAWAVASLPGNGILREIVLKGFMGFIDARVRVMRRRQLAYNSQGIRCDGNYKLAKILRRAPFKKRTATVVIAFCGTDGSLLDVPVPLPTEGFAHVEKVLEPLLREIQEVRLACGYTLLESQPVFHATDVYHIHDACLRRLYNKVWSGLRVATHGATPKGGVQRRTVLPPESVVDTCIPTGEPQHCIITARRLVCCFANDARHFINDYAKTLNGLSLEDGPVHEESIPPPNLPRKARHLLKSAIVESSADFANMYKSASKATQKTLKDFVTHPGVCESQLWKKRFGSAPPLGVLGRLAKLLDVELHANNRPQGWKSQEEFRQAVRRLERWYSRGRQRTMWRRGMKRGPNAPDRVKGRQCVMNKKLRTHLKNLRSFKKVEGLWAWRLVARGLRKAGIPVHTGTVPVERLWAALNSFFPSATRRMEKVWWQLLMKVCYMRYNYRHFNHATLPAWTEGDALLSERMDALASITRALHNAAGGGDDECIRALQDSFAQTETGS